MSSLLKISIIMPVYNEAEHLNSTLDSLINNDYPAELIEFIIVDGGSNDGTLGYVENFIRKDTRFSLLHNPKTITPISLNMGIEAASHEVIVRADAHAIYDANYLREIVTLLQAGVGDCVGARVVAVVNKSKFSWYIAQVLNSKLGSGGAGYRSSNSGRVVDTVWCGCWFKRTLVSVGMFNPLWLRNQDSELNYRLRKLGYVVYSTANTSAQCVVRNTYSSLLKQYFNYGIGRANTMAAYPDYIQLRQVLPIITLIVFLITLCFSYKLIMLSSILLFILGYAFKSEIFTKDIVSLFDYTIACFVLGSMSSAWAVGCLYGLLKKLSF